MNTDTISFQIGRHTIELEVSTEAFSPTTTSRTLYDEVKIPAGGAVLDLGCGVGPLAIAAALDGAAEVYAVDIMERACELAQRNVARNGVADRVKVVQGDLFAPVRGVRFDAILDDVSGIAERVARWTPWFPETIPAGGPDGTLPTIRMLKEAKQHLKPGGMLYFPVLSLANATRILDEAKGVFRNGLELIQEKRVPFCPELSSRLAEMEEMKRHGVIDFITKRGRSLWTLQIFRAWDVVAGAPRPA